MALRAPRRPVALTISSDDPSYVARVEALARGTLGLRLWQVRYDGDPPRSGGDGYALSVKISDGLSPGSTESGPAAIIPTESSEAAIRAALIALTEGFDVAPTKRDPTDGDPPVGPNGGSNRFSNPTSKAEGRITEREREVLTLVAHGLSNGAVALRLDISESTVKYHLASLYARLNVNTRVEAVREGIRAGIISA